MSQAGIISERSGTGPDIKTLTGDTGGKVAGDSLGNVDLLGTSAQGLSFAGTPASNLMTGTISNASASQKGVGLFPAADFINSSGTITLVDTVVKSVTTDSGILTPSGHSFSILGGEGMDITHASTTITVAGEDATTTNKGIVELASDAETQLLADTARAVTPSNIGAVFAPQKNSGFQEWTGAGSYYTINTQDFVLDRPGIGWINNVKITWLGAQTEAALTKGATHYIYIDSSGTIGSTTTRSTALFQDNIVVFEVLVDNDTPANVIVVKENHTMMINPLVMEFCHDIGLHGFNVTEEGAGGVISLNGTLGIQVDGNTEWLDHDLETDVPDSSSTAVNMNIMYTDAGGKWVQDAVQNTVPTEYNNAGTPTALGGNQRAISCIWVSKDDIESASPQYFLVMGDVLYNNLAAAVTALANSLFTVPTNELLALEMVRMGHVIVNATTIDSVTSSKQTIGTGTSVSTGGSANLVSVDVTNFDGWLSATDTTVQTALETLDDTAKDGTWHLENTADGTKILDITLAAISNSTTRTITYPDQDVDMTPNTGTYPAAAGGTQIVTLGTIATGTWEATDVGVQYGGTGVSSLTDHGILVGSGTAAITVLTVGTNGQLCIGSTGADPVFGTPGSSDSTITWTLGAGTLTAQARAGSEGQTGVLELATGAETTTGTSTSLAVHPDGLDTRLGTQTQYGLVAGGGGAGNNLAIIAPGSNGQLCIGSTGAAAAFATPGSSDSTITWTLGANTLTAQARAGSEGQTGVLELATGAETTTGTSTSLAVHPDGLDTRLGTQTDHGIMLGAGGAGFNLGVTAALTNGQLAIGNTGNDPSLATLASADSSITITNTAGAIDLAVTGGGIAWANETGATKQMAVGKGYTADRGGGVAFTLPDTAAYGTIMRITGVQGLWSLLQNAGDTVYIGDTNTTPGAGGSLTATDAGDCIEILCIVADTDFRVISGWGNVAVV